MFNKLFGSKNEDGEKESIWTPLSNITQLDEIQARSVDTPILIFKHSTRCSISRMALRQFESEYNRSGKTELYLLDLLNHRDISEDIANRFNVVHQSPQALLIKNGEVVYHDSHGDINAEKLADFEN
jgi:bacillithiol system protein YtxJ